MSGNHSRRKGSVAERELFALLSDYLGIVCKRNLVQTREGGADCIDIPGIAIEVKRRAKWPTQLELSVMWSQTCLQAEAMARKPMLWLRADRQHWCAAIRLSDIEPELYRNEWRFALIGFEPAVTWMREQL